ncbi:MAG: DUF3298 domain-containing protein [Clostridia bacterium]|nr:DUF3298 domain-containing protein [Clostridia bacterium]
MHNIIIKLISIVPVLIFMFGCASNRVNVKCEEKIYETENEIVSIEIPVISGLKNKEFEEEINCGYNDRINDILNSYLNDSEKTINERNGKSKLEIKQNVSYNKNGLLSIVGECYKYTDGLNGTSTRIIKNINTQTNSVLLLEDLFSDDEYVKMLDEKLERQSEDAKYSDLWEIPKISAEQNEFFYFSDEGLVLFYPPYELSYYARGFVEFTIPYSDLYGYLKPEYSFLY